MLLRWPTEEERRGVHAKRPAQAGIYKLAATLSGVGVASGRGLLRERTAEMLEIDFDLLSVELPTQDSCDKSVCAQSPITSETIRKLNLIRLNSSVRSGRALSFGSIFGGLSL